MKCLAVRLFADGPSSKHGPQLRAMTALGSHRGRSNDGGPAATMSPSSCPGKTMPGTLSCANSPHRGPSWADPRPQSAAGYRRNHRAGCGRRWLLRPIRGGGRSGLGVLVRSHCGDGLANGRYVLDHLDLVVPRGRRVRPGPAGREMRAAVTTPAHMVHGSRATTSVRPSSRHVQVHLVQAEAGEGGQVPAGLTDGVSSKRTLHSYARLSGRAKRALATSRHVGLNAECD
jgi:hypothetical protein